AWTDGPACHRRSRYPWTASRAAAPTRTRWRQGAGESYARRWDLGVGGLVVWGWLGVRRSRSSRNSRFVGGVDGGGARHRQRQVAAAAVVGGLRGVDPHLGELGVVDLDPGRGPELVDEVLLRGQPLVAEQLAADRRLGVVERPGHRSAPAGLLEHVP